jgi:hypothetical protein
MRQSADRENPTRDDRPKRADFKLPKLRGREPAADVTPVRREPDGDVQKAR